MLPSPPHWATSRPPGRSAACRRANSRSWSAIQWNVAVERIASTRLVELEVEQVEHAHVDAVGAGRRARSLAASTIEADASTAITLPARQALDQRLGDPPRAAARVEHDLVARQLQAREHLAAQRLHRPRDAVVARAVPCRVPLAYERTLSRTVQPMRHRARRSAGYPARATSSASSFESCPPCQAIGERGGGPASSTIRRRAGDRLRVAFADRERMARVGLVAAGDDDASGPRWPPARCSVSNGRERGTTSSASATAVGMLVGGQALAQHRLDRLAPALGHGARGRRPRRSPPRRPRRSPARERVPAARARAARRLRRDRRTA